MKGLEQRRIQHRLRASWQTPGSSWLELGVLSHFSHVRLFPTPWTAARQAPLSMEFSRQEYWSRLPFPSPGDLPKPGIKPVSLLSPALAGGFFTISNTYIYPFFFRLFSNIGHYRVLSRVSCAIQRSLLVIYFIYSSVYMSY